MSASDICLAFEKLILASGDFVTIKECANKAAGPWSATTKVSVLIFCSDVSLNSYLGCGGMTNSYYSPWRCYSNIWPVRY